MNIITSSRLLGNKRHIDRLKHSISEDFPFENCLNDLIPITVSSGNYPDQNVLNLNSLPPSLQNILTQEDLDWFIFNLGEIFRSGGYMLSNTVKGLGESVSATGISDLIRNVFSTATSFITKLSANMIGTLLNGIIVTGGDFVSGIENWLSPSGGGGGLRIANEIAGVFSYASDFIKNGLITSIESAFKSGTNYFELTFPDMANLFIGNVLQTLPELIANSFDTFKELAINGVQQIQSSIFNVGKYFGGWSGSGLNISIPRIINIEKQDIYCQWAEWWFFESPIGKLENQINPAARLAKEAAYKSICYQTNVATGGELTPLFPFGSFWLPSQVQSLINGIWHTSFASRGAPLPRFDSVQCSIEMGTLICKQGGDKRL